MSPQPKEKSKTSSPGLGREQFAVKIIRTDDDELKEIAFAEYKLVMNLDHPNIIRMHDAFYNSAQHTMYIVMDLIVGDSLREFLEVK